MKEYLLQFRDFVMGYHNEAGKSPNAISNQDLINRIFEVYIKRFKEECTDDTMLYPTCFRIYLHPSDFNARKQAFNVISRDSANKFNKYNRSKMQKYENNIPHSPHWLFQFIELKEDSVIDGAESIKMGDVWIISDLYSQDFSRAENNISQSGKITQTKNVKRSIDAQHLNEVNKNAFWDIDQLDNNRFRIKIANDYSKITITPKSDAQMPESDVLAYLECNKNFISGNTKGNRYNITAKYIEISGKNDTRSESGVVKIDSDTLPNSIVHIKYENNKFQLAAFGKVRLNEALVPESKGGDLRWQVLSKRAKMMINNEVSIEFVQETK